MTSFFVRIFAIVAVLGTIAFNNFPKPAAICGDLIKKDHVYVTAVVRSSEHELAEKAREARLEELDCDDPYENQEADYLCNR
jgi:hypothetical protein